MTNLRDYFTFQSLTLTSDSWLRLFLSELIYPLNSLTNYCIYNESALSKKALILNNNYDKIKIKKRLITGDVILLFVVVFFGYNQYCPDGFMFLCPGAPAQ